MKWESFTLAAWKNKTGAGETAFHPLSSLRPQPWVWQAQSEAKYRFEHRIHQARGIYTSGRVKCHEQFSHRFSRRMGESHYICFRLAAKGGHIYLGTEMTALSISAYTLFHDELYTCSCFECQRTLFRDVPMTVLSVSSPYSVMCSLLLQSLCFFYTRNVKTRHCVIFALAPLRQKKQNKKNPWSFHSKQPMTTAPHLPQSLHSPFHAWCLALFSSLKITSCPSLTFQPIPDSSTRKCMSSSYREAARFRSEASCGLCAYITFMNLLLIHIGRSHYSSHWMYFRYVLSQSSDHLPVIGNDKGASVTIPMALSWKQSWEVQYMARPDFMTECSGHRPSKCIHRMQNEFLRLVSRCS